MGAMNKTEKQYKMTEIVRELIVMYELYGPDEKPSVLESRISKAVERFARDIPYRYNNGELTSLWDATLRNGAGRPIHYFTEEQKKILFNSRELIRYMLKNTKNKEKFRSLMEKLDYFDKTQVFFDEEEVPTGIDPELFEAPPQEQEIEPSYDYSKHLEEELILDDPDFQRAATYLMIRALFEEKYELNVKKLQKDVKTVKEIKTSGLTLKALYAKRRLRVLEEYVRLKRQE